MKKESEQAREIGSQWWKREEDNCRRRDGDRVIYWKKEAEMAEKCRQRNGESWNENEKKKLLISLKE